MAQGDLPPLTLEFDVDDRGASKIKKIEGTLDKMGHQLDRTAKKTTDMSGKTGKFGRVLDKVGARAQQFNQSVELLRLGIFGLIGVFTSFAGAIIPAITAVTRFESEINSLGRVSVTALDETAEMLLDLPAALGQPVDIVTGYYNAISAGAKQGREALDLLTTASQVAKIAHLEQGDVIKALTKLMTGYQGEIATTAQAADLLFTIEEKGQTTISELIPIIGDIAAVSKNTAITHQELAAGIAVVTQTAGSAARGVTSLKSLMSVWARETSQMKKVLKALNVESAVWLFQNEGFKEGLDTVVKKADEMGISLIKLFGSIEAVQGVLALTSQDWRKYDEALVATNNTTGKTAEAWDKFINSTQGAFDELFAEIEKLLIQFGLLTEDKPRDFLRLMGDIVKTMQEWIQINKEFLRGSILEFFRLLNNLVALTGNLLKGLIVTFTVFVDMMNTLLGLSPVDWFDDYNDGLELMNDNLEKLVKNTAIDLQLFGLSWQTKLLEIKLDIAVFVNDSIKMINNLMDTLNIAVAGINKVRSLLGNEQMRNFGKFDLTDTDKIEQQLQKLQAKTLEVLQKKFLPPAPPPAPEGDPRRGTESTRRGLPEKVDEAEAERVANEKKQVEDRVKAHLQTLEDMRRSAEQAITNANMEGVEQRIHQMSFEADEAILQLERQKDEILEMAQISDEQRIALTKSTADTIKLIEQKLSEDIVRIKKEETDKQMEELRMLADRYIEAFDPIKTLENEKRQIDELITAGLIDQRIATLALIEARERQQEATKQLMMMEGGWLNGTKVAFMDYKKQANDTAENMLSVWNTTFSGLENSLTSFISTGKADFESLADTILAEANRMLFVKPLLASLFGGPAEGEDAATGLFGFVNKIFGAANGGIAAHNGNGVTFMPFGGMMVNGERLKATNQRAGITDGPTVIAGEKYRNEAFIPLPSGGQVPVVMKPQNQPEQKITQIFNIQTRDLSDFEASENQIFAKARQGIARANRRG